MPPRKRAESKPAEPAVQAEPVVDPEPAEPEGAAKSD